MNKYKLKKILFFFLLTKISFCISSEEENEPIIYAYQLEYRLNKNSNEQYVALLDEISRNGVSFKKSILPIKRANKNFQKDKTSCIFPTTLSVKKTFHPDLKEIKLIQSDPIDKISMRVFTRPDEEKISSMEELKKRNIKAIAYWQGLNIEKIVPQKDTLLEPTPNEEVRLKMLYSNRADAIIGFMPDVYLAADKLQLPKPLFNENFAILLNQEASLVCHDTEKNIELIKNFNQHIKNMKENGKLSSILGRHADIVYKNKK